MEQDSAELSPEIEVGTFFGKVPYVKRTGGPQQIIVFGSSDELMICCLKDPVGKMRQYGMFLPKDCTIWNLGVDPNIPAGFTIEQQCEEYARVIKEKIGPGAYPIMGVSYGGLPAQVFAAKYPELTSKLILVVSAYVNSASGFEFIRDAINMVSKGQYYECQQKAVTLSRRKIFQLMMKVMIWSHKKQTIANWNPPTTLINAYTHVLESGGERKKFLPDIKAPTIIFGGDRDQFFSEEVFRETAKLIPNAQFVFFPGETHGVVMEKGKAIRTGIAEFLAH